MLGPESGRRRAPEPRDERPPPHRSCLQPLHWQPIVIQDAWERAASGLRAKILPIFFAAREAALDPKQNSRQAALVLSLQPEHVKYGRVPHFPKLRQLWALAHKADCDGARA